MKLKLSPGYTVIYEARGREVGYSCNEEFLEICTGTSEKDAACIASALNCHEELLKAIQGLIKNFPNTENQNQVDAIVFAAKAAMKAGLE